MTEWLKQITIEPIDAGYLLTVEAEWARPEVRKGFFTSRSALLQKIKWLLDKEEELAASPETAGAAADPEPVPA